VGLAATAETDESACDNSDAAFGDPIAFFTALQIVSRENGFSRKSDGEGRLQLFRRLGNSVGYLSHKVDYLDVIKEGARIRTVLV